MSKGRVIGFLSTAVLCGVSFPANADYSPPLAGMVGWWRGDGNANDSSGNGLNGTVIGNLSFVPGVFNQAFSISSGSDRVYVPDNAALNLTGSLSIAAWIYQAQPLGSDETILLRGDNRQGLDPYSLGVGASGQLGFTIQAANASDYTALSSPNAIPVYQWVQVTAIFDASTGDMRLYMNGNLSAETYTPFEPFAPLDPTQDPSLGIGNPSGTMINFPFLGYIDEVLLYSRALSPTEVASLAVVPEPSTLALAGLGAAGLLISRRPR